jgi:hypothetical protein
MLILKTENKKQLKSVGDTFATENGSDDEV